MAETGDSVLGVMLVPAASPSLLQLKTITDKVPNRDFY